jgi:antibiotic biosynthesis monooxygenase (ABM) superfamily enzyme
LASPGTDIFLVVPGGSDTPSDVGATVVITHRVRGDKRAEYEAWVGEISPLSRSAPGHLDWHLVRPIPGATETYTVIIRFQTTEHVRNWINSSERKRLIEKVQPLLVSEDDFYVSSGLDFWFTPAGAKAKVPVRWKQYLLTWSAIYPLVLGVPQLVSPAFGAIGFSHNVLLHTFAVTAVVVYLMIYVVMPRYTRLLKRWLFA